MTKTTYACSEIEEHDGETGLSEETEDRFSRYDRIDRNEHSSHRGSRTIDQYQSESSHHHRSDLATHSWLHDIPDACARFDRCDVLSFLFSVVGGGVLFERKKVTYQQNVQQASSRPSAPTPSQRHHVTLQSYPQLARL